MTEKNPSTLEDNEHTAPSGLERRRIPGNVYYIMPNYWSIFWSYGSFGAFGCQILESYVSANTSLMLWTGYLVFLVILGVLNPAICHKCKKIDEEGKEVIVRYPLVGLRACEVELDLEGIEKGVYDKPEGKRTDEMIHDGRRYARALLRI